MAEEQEKPTKVEETEEAKKPTQPLPISEAIKWLRENAPKRKFTQSFDIAVNLKNIDMKKPESKFAKDVSLPNGVGKPQTVCLIADNVKGFEPVVGKDEIDVFGSDKKAAKKFVKQYMWFMAEPPLMPLVGKVLGRYLAPVGRMPKLLPPRVDPKPMAEQLSRSTRIRLKDSPVVHCCVGGEKMTDEQIVQNIDTVIDEVRKSLPGKSQIKNAYLKLTMGPPVKLDIK